MNEYFRRPFNRAVDYAIDRGVRSYLRDPVRFTDRISNVRRYFLRSGHIRPYQANKLALTGAIKGVQYGSRSFSKNKMPPTPPKTPRKINRKTLRKDMANRMTTKEKKLVKIANATEKRRLKKVAASRKLKAGWKTITRNGTPSRNTGQMIVKAPKTRKVNMKSNKNMALYGSLFQKEVNINISGATCLYVTQALPLKDIRTMMAFGFTRKIFHMLEINFTDFLETVPINAFGDGSVFGVVRFELYYWTVESPTQSSSFLDFTTGTTKFRDIGIGFRDNFDATFKNLRAELQFDRLEVKRVSGLSGPIPVKSYDVSHMRYNGFATNNLSFQNVSINSDTVGNSSLDSVNQNPLSYQVYEGKGNGPLPEISKRSAYTTLVADNSKGWNSFAPGLSTTPGNELFPTSVFGNCKKVGYGNILPAQIVKSNMYKKVNGNFWKLWSILIGRDAADVEFVRYGTFKTYGFDKIVTKSNDTVLTVACEFNQEIGGYCTNFNRPKIVPLVEA